jgi:hypothetical protein
MDDRTHDRETATAEQAPRDPLQQVGTHPFGTVAGALIGAGAGAIVGIAAGPVGSLAGAVAGAVAGGALGSGAVGRTPVEGPVVEAPMVREGPSEDTPALPRDK